MSRIDIKNFILGENSEPNKPAIKRGATGHVEKAGIFGRSIKVEFNGKNMDLNRGSLIEFINANKTDSTQPDFEKHYFKWSDDTNSNDDALQKKFTEVMRNIQTKHGNSSIQPNIHEELPKDTPEELPKKPVETSGNNKYLTTDNKPTEELRRIVAARKIAYEEASKTEDFYYLASLIMDFDNNPTLFDNNPTLIKKAQGALQQIEKLTHELGKEEATKREEQVAKDLQKPNDFFKTAYQHIRETYNSEDWYDAGVAAEERNDIETAFNAFITGAEMDEANYDASNYDASNYDDSNYEAAKKLATEHNISDVEKRLDKAKALFEKVQNQIIDKGKLDGATSSDLNRAGLAAENLGNQEAALEFFLKSANKNSSVGLQNAQRLANVLKKPSDFLASAQEMFKKQQQEIIEKGKEIIKSNNTTGKNQRVDLLRAIDACKKLGLDATEFESALNLK